MIGRLQQGLTLARLFMVLSIGLMAANATYAAATAWQQADHLQVRLISELETLSPKGTFHLGVEFKPEEHWHVYWRNPGDSGMPISVSWELPTGLTALKTLWPIPAKIPFGHLTNYGYEGPLVLPVRFKGDALASNGVTVKAQVSWLVCKDTCVPGSASFELPLSVGQRQVNAATGPVMHRFIQQEPNPLLLMQGELAQTPSQLSLTLYAKHTVFKNAQSVVFFPINEGVFESGAKPQIRWKRNFITLTQNKADTFYKVPKTLSGLLVVDGRQAWEFEFMTQ